MKKSREIISQEGRFLRLCSEEYKNKVRGKVTMNVNDYDKICHILSRLDMYDYMIYFAFRYEGLLKESIEKMNQHDAVYSKLYPLEDNQYAEMDKCQCWREEFWQQIPSERLKKKYRILFTETGETTKSILCSKYPGGQ